MTARATPSPGPGFAEFVTLIALIISLVALSIDAMLPALPEIAADLDVVRINDSQYVISVFFAGMGLGQLFFGPLSDSIGRRPAILSGLLLFLLGCLLSIVAVDFTQMLLGRFLQGLGASGPRIVSIALVRDKYRGREMARVMSFVMTVLLLADWRYIFAMFLCLAFAVGLWFWRRQPETLARSDRIAFSFAQLILDVRAILRIRAALGYTLTMGFIFGAFLGYLSSSQQIFQVQYQLQLLFPLYFGILAVSIGCASLVNARLCLLSFSFLLCAWYFDGHPHLNLLMLYLLPLFFCFGILFGNLNALAMEPLGRIAGLGSAVVGSISTLISAFFGVIVADTYNATVLPLVLGFALLGAAGLLVMRWTEAELAPEH
jgi:DHA1 family bicyclomycin/chloramphenicol resistance-like MFS transporter